MKESLGFFSSDARPLYIIDILRTLALPRKSVIHFRYDQKYVDEDIKGNMNSFIGYEGIIFYMTGNLLSKREDKRIINTYSIRKVIIKDIECSDITGLYHFYLELGDYCDCKLDQRDEKNFVSKIQISDDKEQKWIEKVKSIKDSIEYNVMFFNYEILDSNMEVLNPEYTKLIHTSVYNLNDESEYIMKCSFYDKLEGSSYLEINDSEIIKIYHKDKSGIGAVIDDRQYKISISTIAQSSVADMVRLFPKITDTDDSIFYDVVTLFKIKKRKRKGILFGLYTSLLFASAIVAQLLSSWIKEAKPWLHIAVVSIVIWISVWILSALLYLHFNKK